MAITAARMWLDGDLVASTDAKLAIMSHVAQRGSLVFDVGSFHRTARGPALFRAREHVARFLRSARKVGLEIAHDAETLAAAAAEVAALAARDDGLVRWSAFFAAGEPDLVPRSSAVHVAVAAQILEDPPRTTPLAVAFFDDARKASPAALDPSIKAAAAYLGPMLARRRAVAAGADEIVLLDEDGLVAEAPTANVFAVVAGSLWTPPLRYVLDGITRDAVLVIAKEEGIAVREEPLPSDELARADEAFLTATSFPIAAIGAVNGRALVGAPGPVTSRIAARIAAVQGGEDPRHASWLQHVRAR